MTIDEWVGMDFSVLERIMFEHLIWPLESGIMKIIDESGYVSKYEKAYVSPPKREVRGAGKNPFAVPHASKNEKAYVSPPKFEVRGVGKNPFAVPHISRMARK